MLSREDIGGLRRALAILQGVVDADYSLSPPKTVCEWWRATSYEW